MLTSLSIQNYALIDVLNVDFNNGLSIITGETGAGKSILLGGLSLILGKRAELSAINDTSKKCIIEAVFDLATYDLKPVFQNLNIDYDTETILRREILPSGKSRAFINDSPVNLSVLSKLSQFLIDIHSQHQTLELTEHNFQLDMLDALANNKNLIAKYMASLSHYKEATKDLEILMMTKAEAIKEYDYNAFLLNELEEANLKPDELKILEAEQHTLSNVEFITQELQSAHHIIGDDQVGILQALAILKLNLSRLSEISTSYVSLFERVNSSYIELDDLYTEIEHLQDNLELNPSRLEELNSKLQSIHNLFLKHNTERVEDLIQIQYDLDQKVESYDAIDDAIVIKQNLIQDLESNLNDYAVEIHNNRKNVLPELIIQLEALLADLGMENAKFKIEVQLTNQYFANGKDEITLLLKANKGGAFLPLKKAASGGELSRIMLAIKSILANYMQLPTIMFDEIDTGVSGEISNKMGAIMQQMSKNMQVFAITHLPQIAAKGDTHFKVFKYDEDEVTKTSLVKLNTDERNVEIAQMLGGKQMTTSAIAHAKQLLN